MVDGVEAVAQLIYTRIQSGEDAVAIEAAMPGICLVRTDRIVRYMPIGGYHMRFEPIDRVATELGEQGVDEDGVVRLDKGVHIVFLHPTGPFVVEAVGVIGFSGADGRLSGVVEEIGMVEGEVVFIDDTIASVNTGEVYIHCVIRTWATGAPHLCIYDAYGSVVPEKGIVVEEGVIITDILMNRNRDKRLDEIIKFEDRVATVLGSQTIVVDVGGRDFSATPCDGIAEATLTFVLEEIGRFDGQFKMHDAIAALYRLEGMMQGVAHDRIMSRRRIFLCSCDMGFISDRVAEIVTLRIAEDEDMSVLVVADRVIHRRVIRRSHAQREIEDRVALMDGTPGHCIQISSIGLHDDLILCLLGCRTFEFLTAIVLPLPRSGIIVAEQFVVVDMINRVNTQTQHMNRVASVFGSV